jgi:hypothetical protein
MTKKSWEDIFEGNDERSVQQERAGYHRKPTGTQDQGSRDEND